MNGWRYEWVDELPRVVRELAIEWLHTPDE